MSSYLKQAISSKISRQLTKYDGINSLEKKLFYLAKLNRVDKSSKELGIFSLNLKPISEDLEIDSKNFQRDESIESIKFDKSSKKVLIKTNFNILKQNVLREIFTKKSKYGFELTNNEIYPKIGDQNQIDWCLKLNTNAKTIVEFSSPNIAKPLHAGHMRSTFLGNFLSNLHDKLGQNVVRINYLGDWGTQYGILAVGFKKYGSLDKLNESPIKHLLEVYVKANQDESLKADALSYFADMESRKEETLKMWKLFKDLSVKELEQVYKSLNIKFDSYEAESQYYEAGKKLVKILCDQNIAKRLENGTIQVKIDEPTIQGKSSSPIKFIIEKSDGSTLYITRDIAAILERKKVYDFSKIVYVVDSGQRDHFRNLYEAVKKIDESILKNISFNEFYVPFGRMTNMSTRRGKVEFLSDLIVEAKQVAYESMGLSKNKRDLSRDEAEHVAQNIGNSHLIITDMSRPRLKDYEFSWSNIVSKDDSAYMCHYAHARLYSLINKCKEELKLEASLENVNIDLLNKPMELILIQHLARFDEAVWQAYEESEPYHIVIYLFQLVKLLNKCLIDGYVLNEEIETARARLLLYNCCKQIIVNSFEALGITPLNRI